MAEQPLDHGVQIRFISDLREPRRPPRSSRGRGGSYGVAVRVQGIAGQPFVVLNSGQRGRDSFGVQIRGGHPEPPPSAPKTRPPQRLRGGGGGGGGRFGMGGCAGGAGFRSRKIQGGLGGPRKFWRRSWGEFRGSQDFQSWKVQGGRGGSPNPGMRS
ncbi:cingulin-like isoform 2-T2 [Geothlypis trichas]